MENKRAQRSQDRAHFAKICKLFEIPLQPRSNLVLRSEYLHFHHQVGKIKSFVVLGCVEKLMEKCSRLESELQCHLEQKEAGAAVLREELAQLPAEENTSFPPIDVRTFLSGPDIDATWLWSNGEGTGRVV